MSSKIIKFVNYILFIISISIISILFYKNYYNCPNTIIKYKYINKDCNNNDIPVNIMFKNLFDQSTWIGS